MKIYHVSNVFNTSVVVITREIWILLCCFLLCASLHSEPATFNSKTDAYTTSRTFLNSSTHYKGENPAIQYTNSFHPNETLVKHSFHCITPSPKQYKMLKWYRFESLQKGTPMKSDDYRSGPFLNRSGIILETNERGQRKQTFRCQMFDSQVVSESDNSSVGTSNKPCQKDAECLDVTSQIIMKCNQINWRCECEKFSRSHCLKKRSLNEECLLDRECEVVTIASKCDKTNNVCHCKSGFKQVSADSSTSECRNINELEEKLKVTFPAIAGGLSLGIIILLCLMLRKKRSLERNARETLQLNCSCQLNDKPPSYEDILKEIEPPPPYPGVDLNFINENTGCQQSIDDRELQSQEQPSVASSSNKSSSMHHQTITKADQETPEINENSILTESEEVIENDSSNTSKSINEEKSSSVFVVDSNLVVVQRKCSSNSDNIVISTYL